MKRTIFYSWQSNLDKKSNMNFQGDCVKKAIKELNASDQYEVEFSIDRATANESGAPSITDSIFSKIDKAALFVADISIINSGWDGRKAPNPNVLIELGYAASILGWSSIIHLFNEATGTVKDLPFDLRFRRITKYKLTDKSGSNLVGEANSNIKKKLTKDIKDVYQYSRFECICNS